MPRVRALDDYLDTITGRRRGQGWIEVRFRHPGGMHSRFYSAARPLGSVVQTITRLGATRDVYVGCALRTGQRGDRAHVGEAWCLWAECDGPDSRARLDAFAPVPSLLIASGTPGNVHAYWALVEPVDADTVEDANRRLADAVGGDPVCYDAARILRPPGTYNYKHTPPAPVAQLGPLRGRPYLVNEVLGGLAPAGSNAAIATPRPASADPLMAIDPARYVSRLTGRTQGRDRKVTCPFHEERTPSLHVYPSAERGWFCFGCLRGGSIYDLAASLWGLETRGSDFIELRERLRRIFP